MSDVRSINALRAARDNDNSLLSPIECLEDAVQDLRAEEFPCNKLMVLCLDDTGGNYSSRFYACNMRASEMLALFEAMKTRVLRDMGYLSE